jgi:hypothetical protein
LVVGDGLVGGGGRFVGIGPLKGRQDGVERGLVLGLAVGNNDATEQEAESVSNDGGTSSRDAPLAKHDDDIGEERVDLVGGFQCALAGAKQVRGKISGVVEGIAGG